MGKSINDAWDGPLSALMFMSIAPPSSVECGEILAGLRYGMFYLGCSFFLQNVTECSKQDFISLVLTGVRKECRHRLQLTGP